MAIHRGGAQDCSTCGSVTSGQVEALAADRCRRPMRVPLSAGGVGQSLRFLALRYEKPPESKGSEQPEQYQLFDTPEYTYRVFVTDMDQSLDALVWFYNQRAGAENLIKEANNDAGCGPSVEPLDDERQTAFQIAMLAYNLNCWLQLFSREKTSPWKP